MSLSGGVTASHILWNLTGTGTVLQTSGGNVLVGTFLATNGGAFQFSELQLTGELINTGGNIQLVSGNHTLIQAGFTVPVTIGQCAITVTIGTTTTPSVCTIPASSQIISNTSWNNFNVPSGTSPTLWVHAHFNSISGIPTNAKSTVLFSGAAFVLNGVSYPMPSGLVTFDPSAPATATTTYNAALNQWQTTINPNNISDENFFVGAAIPLNAAIAGGGTATLQFSTTGSVTPISFSWQWSAAVFTFWPTDWNQALIQPYHGNGPTGSQHAGTPDNTQVQQSLIQGPRGGGSNFTGSWSATGQSGPCQP
jgi:hypothetical protein